MKFINQNSIPHILLSLFILVTIGTRLIKMNTEVMNLCVAIAGICCFVYFVFRGGHRLRDFSVIFCLTLSLLMAISFIYNENARLVNILWIWAYMGAALLLYKYGLNLHIAAIIYYLSSLFFVYQAVTGSAAVDEILNVGSQNNISTLCIFTMVVYYIAELKNKGKAYLSFLPAIIVLFISIWTASRAALFTMAFFIVFIVFYNFIQGKALLRNLFIVITLVVILSLFYVNYMQDFGGGIISKFDRYGVESERTLIWSEYLNGASTSFGNFMFGVKGTDPQYRHLSKYDGNTHNAFLMLHAKFGIVGFLIVMSLLIRSFFKAIKIKRFALLALFSVVIIRSIFDWTAFPGLLDVIFYFFILFYKDKSC